MSPRPASALASAPQARFIVLTGLSGSGKSQAIRALEDLGYFCVDNIPTTLIPTLAELVRREGIARVAIVVDIREKNFLAEFAKAYRKLRAMKGLNPALIFLRTGRRGVALDDARGRWAAWKAQGIRYVVDLNGSELPEPSLRYRVLFTTERSRLWVIEIAD